ncbi:MAG: hypothetical protein JRN09_06845 [Nitrososphaerota archaeon]|nr:hypothetical protein [Nitrososphaerota archaeon]
MQTEQLTFKIGDEDISEISFYCEVARMNKSLLTLSELAELTSADATDEEFEAAWFSNQELSSRYWVESGYVMEESGSLPLRGLVGAEAKNRERARINVIAATELAELCAGQRVKTLAVAGGNSYKSARLGDDIDVFCVTRKDSLWVFMLKALLLARLHRLTRNCPPFCFSYVIDEEKARVEFGEKKDSLFARDALSAHVISGIEFYRGLLLEGSWMQRYFPRLYTGRVPTQDRGKSQEQRRGGNRVLNSFLYYTVGSYVRMKASLLNMSYRKHGNSSASFRSKIGLDHCVYESERYRTLRRMYARRERGDDA